MCYAFLTTSTDHSLTKCKSQMQALPAQRKPDANVGDSDREKLDLHGIRSRKEKNERS